MGIGEGCRDLRRLGAGERAHGVNEPASGFERACDIFQQLFLYNSEFLHVLRLGGPTGVRIALPSANAAAWRIDEDTVEFRFRRQFWAAVPRDGTEIKHFCPGGP